MEKLNNIPSNTLKKLASLIVVLFISVFVIASSSEAHILKGYAYLDGTELNADDGYIEAFRLHSTQGLVQFATVAVDENGYFEVYVPNGFSQPIYFRVILPRRGEELDIGTWYPSALTLEDADAIIFPHGGPGKVEEVEIYFYSLVQEEAAGPVATVKGNVGDNSKFGGVERTYVIIKNHVGIYGAVMTDPKGNYELDNIPFGYYEVIATHPNYSSVIGSLVVGASEVNHNITMSQSISFTSFSEITAESFSLSQNFPNPFNPETTIAFVIPEDSKVSLVVSDMAGREVANLINSDLKAGSYVSNFNASDLSSGIYIYRIQVNGVSGKNFTDMKRMVLVK